jgi:3-O-methylgallate 3,4-dioxygenase
MAELIFSGGLSHTIIDEALDNGITDAIKKNDLNKLAAANWAGEIVDYVPAYRTPTGVGCGMGFAYWNGSK